MHLDHRESIKELITLIGVNDDSREQTLGGA